MLIVILLRAVSLSMLLRGIRSFVMPRLVSNRCIQGVKLYASQSPPSIPAVAQVTHDRFEKMDRKTWLATNAAFQNILMLVKSNRLQDALDCYNQVKHVQTPSRLYFTLTMLIGACQKAADREIAVLLFNEMSAYHMIPNEGAYLALIRCFSASDDTNAALEIIQKMEIRGVELKLRCCHPILESFCRQGADGVKRAFEFISYMKSKHVRIGSEQILLLTSAIRELNLFSRSDYIEKLEDVINYSSILMFGMTKRELVQLASYVRSDALEVIEEEGVLVEPNYVSADIELMLKRYANETNISIIDVFANRSESAEPEPTQASEATPVAERAEKFKIAEPVKLDAANIPAAVFVNVSYSSCLCPNCNASLKRSVLSPEEQSRVREALLGMARGVSSVQLRNLKVRLAAYLFCFSRD
jgi:pentatricopeptide repeat protein